MPELRPFGSEQDQVEECVRLLVRKLRRLHPDAYSDVVGRLPEGAEKVLSETEMRADTRFLHDQAADIVREWPTWGLDDDLGGES